MQQKRGYFRLKFLVLLAIAVIGVGGVVLSVVNIPSPAAPIEKELDAKAFLEQPAHQ